MPDFSLPTRCAAGADGTAKNPMESYVSQKWGLVKKDDALRCQGPVPFHPSNSDYETILMELSSEFQSVKDYVHDQKMIEFIEKIIDAATADADGGPMSIALIKTQEAMIAAFSERVFGEYSPQAIERAAVEYANKRGLLEAGFKGFEKQAAKDAQEMDSARSTRLQHPRNDAPLCNSMP